MHRIACLGGMESLWSECGRLWEIKEVVRNKEQRSKFFHNI